VGRRRGRARRLRDGHGDVGVPALSRDDRRTGVDRVTTFLPIIVEPVFLRERFHSFTTELLPMGAGIVIAIAGVVLVGRDPAVGRLAAGG